jgi:hypothetical protein
MYTNVSPYPCFWKIDVSAYRGIRIRICIAVSTQPSSPVRMDGYASRNWGDGGRGFTRERERKGIGVGRKLMNEDACVSLLGCILM